MTTGRTFQKLKQDYNNKQQQATTTKNIQKRNKKNKTRRNTKQHPAEQAKTMNTSPTK